MKLLFENWRRFVEDMDRRKAFAKDLEGDPEYMAAKPSGIPGSLARSHDSTKEKIKIGRKLKKLYAKYADRSFLDSLTTVHWSSEGSIEKFLRGKGPDRRDELSAVAYLPSETPHAGGSKSFLGDHGIVLRGHITLLANDMDRIRTGSGVRYAEVDPERAKSSGVNKGVGVSYRPQTYESGWWGDSVLVFDKEDWDPAKNYPNEALVDNWNIVGVIVPANAEKKEKYENLLSEVGLDVPVIPLGGEWK